MRGRYSGTVVCARAQATASAAFWNVAMCLSVISVTFISRRPLVLSSTSAGVIHSRSTVSVASATAVCPAGASVMKKRVSKILGRPLGVIQ